MTVTVCIASRGRPNECRKTIEALYARSILPGTEVVVALDEDDPRLPEYTMLRNVTVAPREISLGAKYNRAAANAPDGTTVYVIGIDDAYLSTKGWDKIIFDAAQQFEDGIGAVYFGERKDVDCQLPDVYAFTKGFIEEVGFFCPPYFPTWYHDTWMDEIARMTRRYVWVDVNLEKHGESETKGHKTIRLRDVGFWIKFYDATLPMRISKALEMIGKLDYPEWLRTQLLQDLHCTVNHCWSRNSILRDFPERFEREFGAETGKDDGYQAIKAQAEAIMDRASAGT